jgi:hypothetical protein
MAVSVWESRAQVQCPNGGQWPNGKKSAATRPLQRWEKRVAVAYRFFPAALLAISACFFACVLASALDCFCVAFLFTDFGDLSPIILML